MTQEPYASAKRVFWVVDNGSSHAGRASIERLEGAYTNLRLIHLPIHASWLNQVELYFSIVQPKALTPNDLDSLEQLAERLLSFGRRYREIARPFEWTFTRADLERVLERVDAAQATTEHPNRAHLRLAARRSSGGEQDPGRRPGGARPDRGRLNQARAEQPTRAAREVDQGRGGKPRLKSAAGAQRDHGAGQPSALKRRVDRFEQALKGLLGGLRVIIGERVEETLERRGEQLRQLGMQRKIELRQLGQPIEQPIELVTRYVAKLPRRPP